MPTTVTAISSRSTPNNVGQLQVAWTMSTGVLRGHEGSPLVIGDTMYVHTPFPNNVFAVNLKDQSFKWKYEPKQEARCRAGHVLRYRQPRPGLR